MEPRDASQPWPTGTQPVPAWTKTIAGAAYTVKPLGGDVFGIWRDVEELGTFELRRGAAHDLRPSYADDLSLEARAVVDEFVQACREPFEGAARRDE
jgi:hypothetical protein